MGLADIGEEEPQVVVNLSGRGDDRAWVAARTALLDRDGGGKPFDEIDLRLLELIQELPRIGRERFDVLALAFSINGVEREGRLAGAA